MMHTRNTNRGLPVQAGFTLIELLVVISIIGMLASVILVALQSAKQKGIVGATIQFSANNYHKLGVNTLFSANFNEGSGSQVSRDQTGNFSPSAAVSHSSNTPFSDNGYSLDDSQSGSNATTLSFASVSGNSITIPDSSGITLSLWYNMQSQNPGGQLLSTWFNNSSGSQAGRIFFTGLTARCIFGTAVGYPTIVDANWHNITCSYDATAGAVVLFYDGKQVASTTAAVFTPITLDNVVCVAGFISSGVCATGASFLGLMDNVQIFSGYLLASDAQKLYAEGLKTHALAVSH